MTKTTQGDVTVTDLFAGAGGLTEGFVSQAPERFHPLQAVEWKLDAAATFEQNFPGAEMFNGDIIEWAKSHICLLYTSPSPRDKRQSRMPSSA